MALEPNSKLELDSTQLRRVIRALVHFLEVPLSQV